MGTENVVCINGEIVSEDIISLIPGDVLCVADLAPAMAHITGGTSSVRIHWVADDGDMVVTDTCTPAAPEADLLDEVDREMLSSPAVIDAIRTMESAYERADRGEDVDWDQLISDHGVG